MLQNFCSLITHLVIPLNLKEYDKVETTYAVSFHSDVSFVMHDIMYQII